MEATKETRTEWQYEGKTYIAKPCEDCAQCAFGVDNGNGIIESSEGCRQSPDCIGPYRADGKTIIWIEKQS